MQQVCDRYSPETETYYQISITSLKESWIKERLRVAHDRSLEYVVDYLEADESQLNALSIT